MNLKRMLLLLLLLLVAIPAPVEACPNCKNALAQESGEDDAWARQANGFFWGILLMLGFLGTVGFFLIRLLARAGAEVAAIPSPATPPIDETEGVVSSRDADRV